MDNKTWASWRNEEWVSQLGDAIFRRKESDPSTFANISSSPRVLLEISGDYSSTSDNSQLAALVNAVARIHGDNITRAFDYSKWTPAQKLRPSSVYPQYLTLLFLTIKAASAAENNHAEGQFRDRLKIILSGAGIEVASIDLSGLPKFWQALRAWNKSVIQQGYTNIRLLELPEDVGNETLIGYSKRIAFPSHRDQSSLNKYFLMSDKIGAHDSPAKICSELRGSNRFSETFHEKVEDLYSRVLRNEDVSHHVVMTAIEDINWETELVQKRELGDFEVRVSEARVDHPSGFRLLGDQVARTTLFKSNPEVSGIVPSEQEGSGNLMKDLSLTSLFRLARSLLSGKGSSGLLARLRPFGMLGHGFLLLCKSPSLEYVSSYKVREEDDYIVYFHAKHELEIVKRSQSLDLAQDPEVIGVSHEYRLIRFNAIRRQDLYSLLLCLSPTGRGLENLASREQGIWDRLFSKVNKVYLWSAVSPARFTFPGGTVPFFEITSDEGITCGKLEQADGHWAIDSRQIKQLTHPRKLSVYCAMLGKERVGKTYPLVHSLSEATRIETQKFSDFYYANTKGGLSPAEGLFSIGQQASSTNKGNTAGTLAFKSRLSEDQLAARPSLQEDGPRNDEFVWSTIEHFLLRFQSTKTLSWGNYRAYMSALSRACGVSWHSLDRLFKNSALLFTGYNYQSCGTSIVPFPRLVSETKKEGKRYARLTGLVAPVDVRILGEQGFECVQWGIGDGATVLKPFVFEMGNLCKVEDLVEMLGATLIDEETIAGLVSQEGNSQDSLLKTLPLDREIESATDVFVNGKWERAHEGSCFGQRGVYRKQAFSSTRYYVRKEEKLFETRSNEWAFLLFWSKDGEICEHDSEGNIRLNRGISSLPPLFVAWWMHFGGGAVSYTPEGNLLLMVEIKFGNKARPKELLTLGESVAVGGVKRQAFIERRKLALRKKQLNKDLYYDAY